MAVDKRYNVTAVDFSAELPSSESEFDSARVSTTDIYEVNVALSGVHPRERARMCDICGESFPEGKVRLFRGRYYGVPCGCSRDIGSVILREEVRKQKPIVRGKETESSTLLGWEDTRVEVT